MEPFAIHILGCGSALPTQRHNASAQVVEVRGKFFMVDCGEGTQVQLRKSHIHFCKISAIFISHLHGDHCFGLLGVLSTFGMLGRTNPLHVYAPKDLEHIFNEAMQLFCATLEYQVIFHAVDTEVRQVIYEDRSVTIETIPLDHRVPCCGFIFREKPTLPHIKRDMIDFYDIPISQINNIKLGRDWVDTDGRIIPNHLLVEPATVPRSYAYCSDTRYMAQLHRAIEGVTLLYHESTYTQEYEERAKLYYHSTAQQAATVAKQAHVHQLLLGHYSARYNDEEQLLKEAQLIFPESYLSKEGLVFRI